MRQNHNVYRAYGVRPNQAAAGGGRTRYYRQKSSLTGKLVAVVLVIVAAGGIAFAVHGLTGHRPNVVPENVKKSAGFSVYYPDTTKLPAGFTLDTKSFRFAQKGVVVFALTDSFGHSFVFSEQRQPSGDEINKFVSSYMPLNTTLQLKQGQAKIGAYGNAPDIRSIVSLPINGGPWLIITAPPQVSHDSIVRVLHSLTK